MNNKYFTTINSILKINVIKQNIAMIKKIPKKYTFPMYIKNICNSFFYFQKILNKLYFMLDWLF